MADQPIELNIAFFGPRASGKTCLVSAFYGYQQSPSFQREKGYGLSALKSEDDTQLTKHYNGIASGRPPLSTSTFRSYAFEFVIKALEHVPPVVRINWYDYPGDWWEQDFDAVISRSEAEDFGKVLGCHVAFLLVDGERFAAEGGAYLRTLLPLMERQIKRHRRLLQELGISADRYPRRWILALSKADCMPGDYDAERFSADLAAAAADERDMLAASIATLQGRSPAKAGDVFDYMLLASFTRDAGGRPVVAGNFGLELITPVVLVEALEDAVSRAQKQGFGGAKILVSRFLAILLRFLGTQRDRLPPRLRALALVAIKLQLWRLLDKHVDDLDKARQQAIAKRDVLSATYLSLLGEMRHPAFKRAVFQGGKA